MDDEEPSDEVLARRAALGDRGAFESVVDRHGPALYRYARRMLDDASDTEDCVQEAFAAAWTSLPHFAGRSTLRTWLFAITAHKVRSWQRRRARMALPLPFAPQEEVDGGAVDPVSSAEGTDLLDALQRALLELPAGPRSTWLLREVEGLSYEQIAEVSGTTASTVRGQLHRARAHLIRRMEAWR
ncbi:RNA polymerase sigma factor [Cellulomonas biazotea]|uniref:Putative RNA polymerase sigma factor n=1 Tax=Cellulomonas biazotea TaxID=1709 RepID=A0A402DU12_9CELL|nr:RNA polymerase sigma factor [Cellulomonas biazotea]GCE77588.1 putative RNA polymerase sigma factor [Cellulomonas biazotea]